MSRNTRRQIAYWFMLVLGIALLSFQFKKYFDNTLELKYEEVIVTVIAICMVLNPLSLLELIKTIVNQKYGKNNDQ
nr:hypothetical protein [uncultured Flavobacterium sp.]